LALAVVYAVYYGFNIVYDLLNSPGSTNKDEIVPLTFDDESEARDVDSMEELATVQPQEHLPPTGMIDEPLTANERKEEQEQIPEGNWEQETAAPAGNIRIIADSIISGGLEYGELLKQAVKGAISRSAQIDFG